MRQNVISFANFVLRFGDEKTLLDYAESVLIPAFTDDKLVKSYKTTSFYFYQTKLEVLNEDKSDPIIAITGRLIKDTELRREQIIDPEKGLIKDDASIRSCPSVYFALILNNHRLIFFPETKNSPGFGVFKNTALEFIRKKHNLFIEKLQTNAKTQTGKKPTKKSLFEIHPHPTLEVLPIIASDAMEEFVNRYSVLKQIDFRLIRPNEEIDTKSVLDDVKKHFGEDLNASNTTVTTRNPKGLDKDAARKKLVEASDSDNREINLKGIDNSGNELKGDNDAFKVETPVNTVPADRASLNCVIFQAFQSNVKSKSIQIPSILDSARETIRKISELL